VTIQAAQVLAMKAAVKTDHLERDQSLLAIDQNTISIPAKPRGITSLRITR
jgi:hypothetical protein